MVSLPRFCLLLFGREDAATPIPGWLLRMARILRVVKLARFMKLFRLFTRLRSKDKWEENENYDLTTVLGRLSGWEKGANVSPLKALRISRLSGSPLWFHKLIRLGPR